MPVPLGTDGVVKFNPSCVPVKLIIFLLVLPLKAKYRLPLKTTAAMPPSGFMSVCSV